MKANAPELRRVIGFVAACEGALTVLAVAIGYFLARPPLTQIQWTFSAFALGLLAAAPMVACLLLLTRYPFGPLKALKKLMQELVVPVFRWCDWWELLLVSLLAGVGEELLFRGVLQQGVQQASGSAWLAIGVAGVVFGLAHAITITYAILATLIGVYFGWLLLATDNLLAPIVTHAAYDFVALVYLVRRFEPAAAAGDDLVNNLASDGTNKNSGPIH